MIKFKLSLGLSILLGSVFIGISIIVNQLIKSSSIEGQLNQKRLDQKQTLDSLNYCIDLANKNTNDYIKITSITLSSQDTSSDVWLPMLFKKANEMRDEQKNECYKKYPQ